MKIQKNILMGITALLMAGTASAAVIDFNNGELDTHFNPGDDTNIAESTALFLGGSGNSVLFSNSVFQVYNQGSFDGTAGNFSVGIYFNYDGTGTVDNVRSVIGFTADLTDTRSSSVDTSGNDMLVALSTSDFVDNGGAGADTIKVGINLYDDGAGEGSNATQVTIGAGWYYWELALGNSNGSTEFDSIVSTIYNSDNNGVVGSVVNTYAAQAGNLDNALAADSEVYALFGSSFGGGGINRFDNFTVIPEPGTLALVGIALGGLLIFRRRR